jgi:hypothetical protein
LKNPARPYPPSTPLGVLKYRLLSNREEDLPFTGHLFCALGNLFLKADYFLFSSQLLAGRLLVVMGQRLAAWKLNCSRSI